MHATQPVRAKLRTGCVRIRYDRTTRPVRQVFAAAACAVPRATQASSWTRAAATVALASCAPRSISATGQGNATQRRASVLIQQSKTACFAATVTAAPTWTAVVVECASRALPPRARRGGRATLMANVIPRLVCATTKRGRRALPATMATPVPRLTSARTARVWEVRRKCAPRPTRATRPHAILLAGRAWYQKSPTTRAVAIRTPARWETRV